METNTSEPVTPAGGSSKKGLIIGAVVVGLVVIAGAANSFRSRTVGQAVYDATGGRGTVTTNGEGQTTVKTDQGTVTTGNKLPSDWPSDIPVYTGATVQYAASMNPQTSKAGAYAMLQSSDGADKILAYYQAQLVAQGWKITSTATINGGNIVAAEKDGRQLGLTLTPADTGTSITIGAETK